MVWLIIAGILFTIVLALLLFPVIIDAESRKSGILITGSFSLSWVVLRIKYTFENNQTSIHIFGLKKSFKRKEKVPKSNNAKKIRRFNISRNVPPIGHIVKMIEPMFRLLRELLATIRFRYLKIDTVYGMDDPAYTGILTGYLHALKGSSQMGHNVSFTPDFTRPILDWDLNASVIIMPIRIIPPMARFVTNTQVLRSSWGIIRG